MIFIDNRFSANILIGREGDNLYSQMNKVKIYGEPEFMKDCPTENWCTKFENMDHPACVDRDALPLSVFTVRGKFPFPKGIVTKPLHVIKSDASWGGNINYNNVEFINFKSNRTFCGMNQRAISLNPYSPDYQPIARFYKPRFENVH